MVWKSYAQSERTGEKKKKRLMLLEDWMNFEQEFSTSADNDRVKKLMPKQVKKRRKLTAEAKHITGKADGSVAQEECHGFSVAPEFR
ncbi:hypothetical protein HF521_012256 [Silurus meridionalis]|uniref:Uncharacterized protein n=1 Tax=Silurus meridionalis TaxID=175797 RepID=A0A8T0AH04_SILME|nr:hypothetical protein HF521_012256 [Silurus meridionalis]